MKRLIRLVGPRMSPADGRVVSNFVTQAVKGEPLTVYGDGLQTRSFQYVHDLVDGLILLMNRNYSEPVNLGNPEEYTINDFAQIIREKVMASPPAPKCVDIKVLPAAMDDPKKRKPDITRAKKYLNWQPKFSVSQGLQETIDWFKLQVTEGTI
ncbi:UDP-glucuronic acid decarboxylase 1 [Apophysomyces sp. BC1034]|nr:UDP-glucuronic acid decarboxylase 1 [Apophysomyces sp. BC1015]KAG0171575.1 UDP-glucuronic acid decarboxylase 1 [Apophysomyces sp. BC1021]KAG0184896.1 UDP-glucuronic acid decarboxylase 1 [Apophysomyces sp. BC1034]